MSVPFEPRDPVRRGTVGTLVADQPSGERVEITLHGPRITKSFLVKDLTGGPDHRLYNAIFVSGIPQMGQFHPAFPGAFVGRVNAVHLPDSPTKARVEVEWGFFAQEEQFFNVPQLEILAATVTKTTNFDVHGDPILLEHTIVVINEEDRTSTERVLPPQVAAIQYQEPQHIVIYRRREQQSPSAKGRDYVGTVNTDNVFGDGARMWLCTQLDGFTDGSGGWNVTYAFQRNRDSWRVRATYRDPATGEGVKDPIEGKGIKWVDVYHEAKFGLLDLTIGEPVGPRLGFGGN